MANFDCRVVVFLVAVLKCCQSARKSLVLYENFLRVFSQETKKSAKFVCIFYLFPKGFSPANELFENFSIIEHYSMYLPIL